MAGVGFAFAFLMLLLTHLQSKYTEHSPRSSEEFSVRLYVSVFLVLSSKARPCLVRRVHLGVSRYALFHVIHIGKLQRTIYLAWPRMLWHVRIPPSFCPLQI